MQLREAVSSYFCRLPKKLTQLFTRVNKFFLTTLPVKTGVPKVKINKETGIKKRLSKFKEKRFYFIISWLMAKINYPQMKSTNPENDEATPILEPGMRWTIEYLKEAGFVRVVAEGNFNAPDHLKMLEELISQEFWQPGIAILSDDRLLSFDGVNIEIIRQASINRQKYEPQIGGGKVAIVMNSMTDFTRGRQFQLLTEDEVSAKIRVFLEEQQAIEWLASD